MATYTHEYKLKILRDHVNEIFYSRERFETDDRVVDVLMNIDSQLADLLGELSDEDDDEDEE